MAGYDLSIIGGGTAGLVVNDHLMPTAEGVYAAGDIVGSLRFAHAAKYTARIAL